MGFRPFEPFKTFGDSPFSEAGGDMKHSTFLLLMQSSGLPDYTDTMAAMAWLDWLRFIETSGTTITNYGSLPNGTWAPGLGPPVGALGQTGVLGPNEAYSFNGIDSLATLPANAGHNGPASGTFMFLVRANTAGESSNARLYETNTDSDFIRIVSAGLALRMLMFGTTAIEVITNAGFLSLATDTLLFCTYAFSGDFKGHIYKGVNGVITEATYATQTAGSGSKTAWAATKNIGNNGALSRTFDGLIDEYGFVNRVITLAEMQALALAVTRGSP